MNKNKIEREAAYYSVTPANVRYDKNLPMGARMLYGEITALCNREGYCWASNNYFAKAYKITPQAISKWVNVLRKYGYINIEYLREGKEITERRIFIVGINKS